MTRRKQSFLTIAVIIVLFFFFSRKPSKTFPGGQVSQSQSPIEPGAWKGIIQAALLNKGYSPRQAHFWFLVSNMETAGFTSNLFVKANNPWGMKQPSKRPTTSIGATASGFASYRDLTDAAVDLSLYLQYFGYPADFRSLDDQLIFMRSKGYFGDETLDSYRGKVIAWANKYHYPITYA